MMDASADVCPEAKPVCNRVYRALGALRERLEQSGIRRGDL